MSRTLVLQFNSELVKLLNIAQQIQVTVDPEFVTMRRNLSAAVAISPECAINTLGPILIQYESDINEGRIDRFIMIDYTKHGNDKAKIESVSAKAKDLVKSATKEQIDSALNSARRLLELYCQYFVMVK